MIQLLTRDNKIIYEVEKSELLQDYRSVLIEAIAYNVDLSNLYVDSECIDDVVWNGVNLKNASFINCSMKNNAIIDCACQGLSFDTCNLMRLKIKNSIISDLYVNGCNMPFSSFRNSFLENNFIINSNCKRALFFESEMENFSFHTSDISETVFNKCTLSEVKFIHDKPSAEWINNTSFLFCSVIGCEMNYVDDISVLYFWETNLKGIYFKENERFTEVINTNSKVLYAIDSDVVWWKPYSWEHKDELLFRGTLQEFQHEINNGFPTTNIYPEMDDFEIEDELLKVCVFLNQWRNKR